jgi:hypothetical protein
MSEQSACRTIISRISHMAGALLIIDWYIP